jgi:serine/threonine-protein kinase
VRPLLAKDGEGERLDRFEPTAEIGERRHGHGLPRTPPASPGSSGLVAIKRLHPHLARAGVCRDVPRREAGFPAARIHHPNVVLSRRSASDQGYYLVMDYIEGDTLARPREGHR